MVNELELRDAGKLIHELLCIWDKMNPNQFFSLNKLFISDINSFILFLSDDPAEHMGKLTWLSEISSETEIMKQFCRKQFRPNHFFDDIEFGIPKMIEYSKRYQEEKHNFFFIVTELTEKLHRFYILLGHWILETDNGVNHAKKEEDLKTVLQDLQDFLDK